MTAGKQAKSLGQAIDEIINALAGIEQKDQLVAIQAACSHLSLSLGSSGGHANFAKASYAAANPQSDQTVASTPLSVTSVTSAVSMPATDIRSLREQKSPSSAKEMACIVAYYLQDLAPTNERKDEIENEDIQKYFKQANFPVPKAYKQLLTDSKSAGYFDSTGRGRFKLNPVGYNLVVHGLPREAGQSAKAGKKTRSTKKKPAKKKR